MAYTERKDAPFRKRGGFHRKKKVCVFCGKDNAIDYKDVAKLRKYVSESGKILPRRITGTSDHRHMRNSPESADRYDQESPSSGSYALYRALSSGQHRWNSEAFFPDRLGKKALLSFSHKRLVVYLE